MLLIAPLIITLPELNEYFTERSLNPKGAWHIKFGLTRSSALETDLDDAYQTQRTTDLKFPESISSIKEDLAGNGPSFK